MTALRCHTFSGTMFRDGSVGPLRQLDVLVLDCQATAAAPGGHLLEIAWARTSATHTRAHLIALPNGATIPPAVARVTGISPAMVQHGVHPDVAWRELLDDAAALELQPAPAVIHYARFERPFLQLLGRGSSTLDVVCTHAIARRLFPDLPRRSLRALVGYLGRGVGRLRRAADHVEATAFLWQQLVPRLEDEGITTWGALHHWLATPDDTRTRARKVWPMPRDMRLALPDSPGVYRMLRTNGDVLYVGKAASLHDRVNSHFRKQHGLDERALEMLSQARAISFEVAATPLEAALLECDEIKRHDPPYNRALTTANRDIWFASADLNDRSACPSAGCPLGPIPSLDTLDRLGALARVDRAALASGRWGPDAATFSAGYERLYALHPELSRPGLSPHARLLRLGTRLWREGRRDRDVDEEDGSEPERARAWTPELVVLSLEWLALRAALTRRRAIWLTRLVEASVVWREPGAACARQIVIEGGEIVLSEDAAGEPPIPPGHHSPVRARRERFTVATCDRLRVLTTELKRLVAADAQAAVRFGPRSTLADARLAAALWWV